MKKITLLVALLCSLSAFSARYLVQVGTIGAATWRTAAAGETLVDLTVSAQSLDVWFNALSATLGDEVWIAAGTYNITGTIVLKDGVNVYGGFAGTEFAVADRAKISGGNAWDFSNVTTIDGGNSKKGFSSTADFANNTYIDGFTVTKCTAGTGGGAEIMKKVIILNTIISNCSATGTTNDGGGGVRVKGGTLSYCYIHDNTSATGGGGGIGSNSTSTIQNCLIQNNTVTGSGKGGGGIYVATLPGTTINNCIIKNNTAAGTGGGINMYFSAAQATGLTVTNTQFIGNKALGTIGGAFNANAGSTTPISFGGCSFTGNTSLTYGGAIQVQTGALTIRRCLFAGNISGTSTINAGSAIYGQLAFELSNSLVYNNSGTSAVYVKAANSTFYNNTITQNSGSAIYFATANIAGILTNSVISGNANTLTFAGGTGTTTYPTISYTGFDADISTMTYLGAGCLGSLVSTANFVNPTNFRGAVVSSNVDSLALLTNANWQPLYNAPILNAGTAISNITTDIAGVVTRPQGSAYDMGAYELPYYNTTVTFSAGGTVNSYTSGGVDSEPQGTQLVFAINPTGGYKITSVLYNGIDVTGSLAGNVYTAPVLTANATLAIQFDLGTGLQKSQTGILCFPTNKRVELHGVTPGDEIAIYSIAGSKVKSEKAKASTVSISLPQGIYMVKVAGMVNKVMIR